MTVPIDASSEKMIPEEQLSFTDAGMQKIPEAGLFTIMVGGCSTRVYVN